MSELIVLPPLTHIWYANPLAKPLNNETKTIVLSRNNKDNESMSLMQALQYYPKAALALHPIDAPLYNITLPPLPANRRETALRVKLEDHVLNDIYQLQLAIKPLGNNQFSVATVAKSTIVQITNFFKGVQQAERIIVPLTVYLTHKGEYILNHWLIWKDDSGSGAMPIESNSTADLLTGSILNQRETIAFTDTTPQESYWNRWRTAIILTALCILVLLINLGLSWHNGLKQLQTIDAEITRLFKTALPNTPLSDQPIKQLEQALGINLPSNTTNKKTDPNAPLTITQVLSQLPNNWPSGAVTGFSWKETHLTVTLNLAVLKNIGIDETQINALSEQFANQSITFVMDK